MPKPYDLTKPSDLPDLSFKAFGRTLIIWEYAMHINLENLTPLVLRENRMIPLAEARMPDIELLYGEKVVFYVQNHQ